MKIQTVNQLISVFKDISTRHYQINGFGIGDEWEIGASKAEMHPVLWINPVTATMPSTDSGYKTFEIDFEVRVFDLVSKGETNENDVLSDCIDILKDIITEFKGHPYYVNSQLNIIDDISFEAFTEEFDEEVSGWVCEISLMTPILNSFCGIPAADITGFEFPGTDCPEVNVLCPVFVEDVTGVYPIVVTTVGTTKQVSLAGGVGSDTYVISGVYDTGTLTLTRNDAVDVVVTGFASGGDNDYTTAATLSGNIITFDRTDTVGAYSVDLTSAINSAPDKFVSSGAYDDASKLLTLTLNDASDFDVDFSTLTTTDKFVSSGAYDEINNKIVLTLNDASTVDIDTSAIGGGDNIGNADLTIGAGRVATLTDSLTFKDGTVNIQGIGTAGSSALAIYDNDTTPNKLWDFLDNGDVNLGIDSVVDLGGNGLTVLNGKTKLIAQNATTNSNSDYILRCRASSDASDYFFVGNGGEIRLGVAVINNGTGDKSTHLMWGGDVATMAGSGNYAILMGQLVSANYSGNDVIGMGRTIALNNQRQIALGQGITFTGEGTFGMGRTLTSTAGDNNIIGTAISSTGRYSNLIGKYLQSSATGASVIGNGNTSTGAKLVNNTPNSLALGWNSTTPKHLLSSTGATLGGQINLPNLPTSATGLTTGDLWNDGGTLKIA